MSYNRLTSSLIDLPLSSFSGQDKAQYEAQQRYVRGMELLVSVVQELSLARNLNTITEIVRKAARQLTQADGATFVLKDREFCYYVDEDAISPLWKGQRFPQSICIGGYCMRSQQPIVIPDVEGDERIPIEAYRPTFIKSLVMVPIRTQEPIGAIGNYWAKPHQATAEEIQLLQALADTTSVALENVQVYTELEQRVKDRTQELQFANQELEAFAYTLSHDLRNSLTVLSGFSNVLEAKYAKRLDTKGQKYLSFMQKAVQRINGQIEGMLLLHRVKHTEISCQQVDLSAIASEIMTDLQAREPERSVKIAIAEIPFVKGDPILLQIALENLLSNAWKYSAKIARACIEFGYLEHLATFYIKDNGAGFDMEQADRLFKPFKRLHDREEFAGTGIGLASVARIMARHSGRIWAEASPDAGATFFFTLPIVEGAD